MQESVKASKNKLNTQINTINTDLLLVKTLAKRMKTLGHPDSMIKFMHQKCETMKADAEKLM